MMRVYITTTIPRAKELLSTGFRDLYEFGDAEGVWVGSQPLDINDGFEGDVVLAMTIPVEVFNDHELLEHDPAGEAGVREVRSGRALIPASTLNRYGPAQIYSHEYTGASRRQLLQSVQFWVQAAEIEPDPRCAEQKRLHAGGIRTAIEFFDEIGWLTPLKVNEEQRAG
jgi:hypothetical protein